jgi:steroid 5-alpha reductase family enzyme
MSVTRFLTVGSVCIAVTQSLAYLLSSGHVILHVLAAGAIAIQWAVFLLQASGLLLGNAPTEKYYDLTGAATFFSLTLLSYMHVKNPSWRQALLSSFVMIWCIRLGGFLFNRICRANGRDSRFDNIRTKFLYFWNLWTIQVR